jgi:hypothetical protein
VRAVYVRAENNIKLLEECLCFLILIKDDRALELELELVNYVLAVAVTRLELEIFCIGVTLVQERDTRPLAR